MSTTLTAPAPETLDVSSAHAAPRRRLSGPAFAAGLVVAVAVLVAVRTGPGKIPNVAGWAEFADQWPLYPLPEIQAYVHRQALGQAIFQLLDWKGSGHYIVLNAAALALSGGVLALWLLRRLGTERGAIAVCLLLVSPITVVLLEWIGMYDAFSVLVWVALIVSLRYGPVVQAAAAVLGGFQNFEQFAFSVLVLTLVPELSRGLGLRVRTIALAVGALIGKIGLEAYLSSVGAVSGNRGTFLADPEMRSMVLDTFVDMAPFIIWSALGALWIPALRALPGVWAGSLSLRLRTAAAAAVVLLTGIIAADHTRVMALVAFPAVVLMVTHLAGRETSLRSWLRRPEAWLVLLVPPVVVWGRELLPVGLDLATWGL